MNDGRLFGKRGRHFKHVVEAIARIHRILARTLFSHTIEIEAVLGEHVRLRCSNAMPTAGWLMMIFLHVTALTVTLERE